MSSTEATTIEISFTPSVATLHWLIQRLRSQRATLGITMNDVRWNRIVNRNMERLQR